MIVRSDYKGTIDEKKGEMMAGKEVLLDGYAKAGA